MTAARVHVEAHDLLLLEAHNAPVTVVADLLGRLELRDYRELREEAVRPRRPKLRLRTLATVALGVVTALVTYRVMR